MHIDHCCIKKACAFTGPRPFRFAFGYDENDALCVMIKSAMLDACAQLYENHGVRVFYTGCALGPDQWGAEAVLHLRRKRPDTRLICAAPFPDFVSRWSEAQRKRLRSIWDAADSRGFISNAYRSDVYYARDRFMVDRASFLIAVYDQTGKTAGGTHMTVQYARTLSRTILFINPDTGERENNCI